jgi:DNA-binding response OmpR family regulator
MKARFVRGRATRALAKSLARKAGQKGDISELSPPPSATGKTGKVNRVSVLQVEDNSPTQHLRARILARAGYHVVNVATVRDAITSVAATQPDVILCDVKLPDGSGFEVCREMRARHPGLPVILVSAVYRDEYAKQSGVFGGASEYLVEPLAPAELIGAIKRQTGRTR